MGGTEKCPHALVVPAAGQGHATGCMLLARSLAALGFKITFVYFSAYYAKLKENNRLVPPYLSCTTQPGDHLLSVQSSINGSSADDATGAGNGVIELRVVEDRIGSGDADKHYIVTPTMKQNLFNLILELREHDHTPPTCLVSDSFLPWTLHVAKRAGIPRVEFWTSNALSYLMVLNFPLLLSQGIFPEKAAEPRTQWKRKIPLMLDHIPGLPPLSSEVYPPDMRFADPSDPWVSFLNEISSCSKHGERILIHTVPDIEVDAFRAYQEAGIPAYGIGPLVHYTDFSRKHTPASSQSGVAGQVDCISWLNTRDNSSVIYIAFGSVASLSAEEIQELAFGLEASGSPFLWALREDSLAGAELMQVLPEGFRERTGERGMITGWAPQVEVLAHKAIGGFLSHCGWNSAVESLWQGVPLLCCPRFAEQRSNMHYLCDVWGVGLELERTDTGGLERGFVELGVKALMQEEVGREARGKAQDVMEVARTTCQPGGQSYSNLQTFYDDMKALCLQSTSHN